MKKLSIALFAVAGIACTVSGATQIPGTPRFQNNDTAAGYQSPAVKAELKINVKDDTKEVLFVQDSTNPFVITKAYKLNNADPYIARGYLRTAIGSVQVDSSPVQVAALKYSDGSAFLLVSAEDYRFKDSKAGEGIDTIIAKLDKKDLATVSNTGAYVYFPKHLPAATLMEMLKVVGSNETDAQFAVSPDTMLVDGELNLLMICAPEWSWKHIKEMLGKYDKPMPEVRIGYKVIEIYAENDDRIGVDFQSWKNNDGVDLFSAGARVRRNWSSFFHGGVDNNGSNRTSYWNFNPKWNTRYLDFLTSIGKAKCLAQGVIDAQNRTVSNVQVNSGFFYDRTYYTEGATTIAEGCTEFAYTDPNPNAIAREPVAKILPYDTLKSTLLAAGSMAGNFLTPMGYTIRQMGTQVTTKVYGNGAAAVYGTLYPQWQAQLEKVTPQVTALETQIAPLKLQLETLMGQMATSPSSALQAQIQAVQAQLAPLVEQYTPLKTQQLTLQGQMQAISSANGDALAKYLVGYVKADGTPVKAHYEKVNWDQSDCAPGVIHGWMQYPMVQDGFKFDLQVYPIVTADAATIRFDLNSISLLGWNSDGSPRTSKSSTGTTAQIGYGTRDFVIGGVKKSESVRSTNGLPFVKDLPVIGRLFSTEGESIKQSQLVLVASVEFVDPEKPGELQRRKDMEMIVDQANQGMTSRVGNMFFQQYLLDHDRQARIDRLNEVERTINDEYQEIK